MSQGLYLAILVEKAIDRLAEVGPTLGRPLVDTLEDDDLNNLKELRPGSRGRSEIRIIFIFDPERSGLSRSRGQGRQVVALVRRGDPAGQVPLMEYRAEKKAEQTKEDRR